jgi:hypothetical protein
MKIRAGFVSNSSSCSFLITNTSNQTLTLVDFVKENPQIIKEYLDEYWEGQYGPNPVPYPDPYAEEFRGDKVAKEAKKLLSGDDGMYEYTQVNLIKCAAAQQYARTFKPHEGHICEFGDEDATLIGQVFDYALRKAGKSKNFKWKLDHMNR